MCIRDRGIGERRKLSYVGHVAVAMIVDSRYEFVDDPELVTTGLPLYDDEGEELDETLYDAVVGAFESIPRARRKDLEMVREAIRRAVRSTANEIWGKKPVVTVFLTKV